MSVELATALANEVLRFKPVVARNEMMLTNLEGILNGTGDQIAFITHREELEHSIRLLDEFYAIGLKTTNAHTIFNTEPAEERNKAMTEVYNAVRNGGKYDRQFLENMIIRERSMNAIDRSILNQMNDDLELAIGDDNVQALVSEFKAMGVSDVHPKTAEDPNTPAIEELKDRLTACMIDIGDIALKLKPFYSNEERKTAFDNKVKECSHIPKQLLFEKERGNAEQGISTGEDIVMELQKDLDDVIEKIDDMLEEWTSTGIDTRRTTLYMLSKKAITVIDEIELKIGQRRYILNETASESEMEIAESLNKGKILLGDMYNVCVGEIGTVFASEDSRQEELRNKAEAVVRHFFD